MRLVSKVSGIYEMYRWYEDHEGSVSAIGEV